MSLVEAAIAVNRFGFGARPGQLETLADNPWDWLRAQIRQPAAPAGDLPLTRAGLDILIAVQKAPDEESRKPHQEEARALRDRDRVAHVQSAVASDTPFRERLVKFWTNHFTVSYAQSYVVPFGGAYENEAIRPYATGRFRDLLGAVVKHPAMLFYLDNARSVGPNSKGGKQAGLGLNENLGRELMELHTLGVDGGYNQRDVTSLARIITGWSIERGQKGPHGVPLGQPGTFVFNPNAHEPGTQSLLGISYPDNGVQQGRAALRALASHPSTAKHIGYKLARHFVADSPPPALVARLTDTFTRTRGDLSAVYLALIGSDEAWNPELVKMRSPLEYVVALLRASGERPKPQQIAGTLHALGQPIWNPPGPNGFSDKVDAWASSEGLATRIDVANLIAAATPGSDDPRRFARGILGPLMSGHTDQAMARAANRKQALSLAYLSPEFQRR